MKNIFFASLCLLIMASASAQHMLDARSYTRQDSLRGSVTPERVWWDLLHYELTVAVNPADKSIKGSNIIKYKVLEAGSVMQIDLQSPLTIDKVMQGGQALTMTSEGAVHYINLAKAQKVGDINEIKVDYSGKPVSAKNAPWDGGFSWKKDAAGKDFIATSCQGIGASLWWPCKDHMYDEPDNGILLHINVPTGLVAVGNGRLKKQTKEKNKTSTYTWEVVNPINNYGVNVNIGDYVHFGEKYKGEKGMLDMDYWVLHANLAKAKVHFKDAVRTIEALEHWFGPYPFYEDGYKLVEVPYLGMEHQSSVTYGNDYQMGYKGRDLSGTGWGLKWDYIIIHETGHEWFANNITYKDIADMWIHEGFTNYSESLFTEYFYGKAAGAEYSRGLRGRIENRKAVIGDYGVNAGGSLDMYSKGNNLLHTLRQVTNDDEKWRATLRGLNKEFYHQTVTTKQVEEYMAKSLGLKLDAFFDQYLRDYRVPVLEYAVADGVLKYRWSNCIETFDMPVKIYVDGKAVVLKPNTQPKEMKLDSPKPTVVVDADYYVYSFNYLGN